MGITLSVPSRHLDELGDQSSVTKVRWQKLGDQSSVAKARWQKLSDQSCLFSFVCAVYWIIEHADLQSIHKLLTFIFMLSETPRKNSTGWDKQKIFGWKELSLYTEIETYSWIDLEYPSHLFVFTFLHQNQSFCVSVCTSLNASSVRTSLKQLWVLDAISKAHG